MYRKTILKGLGQLALLVLLMSVGTVLYGQERVVRGTVTDQETGEPLIGVSIAVVDMPGEGTITNFNGEYTISITGEASQLRFSYVGYQTVILDIEGEVMDVQLSSGKTLEEVVVIGYGTQKQKEVTSAVTTVDEEDFNRGDISSPMGLLQGKVAGLAIAKPGSDPNASFDIRLRGLNTFGANSEPLVVVDGVPNVPLETVDPQDIASVNILKDASAASIYGTRGANGVIIITTKKGKKGQNRVAYNGYVSMQEVSNATDVLSAPNYLQISDAQDFGTTTDWFEELTRTAITHVHNVSLSDGTDNTAYRVSLNYRDGEGVAIGNGFEQLNGRLNLNQSALNGRLDMNVNLVATSRKEEYIPTEAFQFATRYNPTAPVREEGADAEEWGGYFQRDAFGFFNPVAIANQSTLTGKKNRLLGSAQATLEIIDGLEASALYTLREDDNSFDSYWSKAAFYTPFAVASHEGYASRTSENRNYEQFESILRYTQDVGELNYEVLGGYTWEEETFSSLYAFNKDFISDEFGVNALNFGDALVDGEADLSSFRSQNRLISFLGRAKFNYDDTYFLTVNFRREGSSKFGENNQWGNFPGASAGVDLTNIVKVPGVDRIKLRAGYGETGNIPVGNFDYLLTFGPQTGGKFFLDGEYVQAFTPTRNPNPDLKWETKKELNIGADFNFLDYRFGASIDYYRVNVEDLILNAPVRVPPNLTDRKVLNIGEMENSGLEFALNWEGIKVNNFSWRPSATFTYFLDATINKFTSPETTSEGTLWFGGLGDPFLVGVNSVRVEEGEELGQIVGPVFTGLDENSRLTYKDADGDGIRDLEVIGNGLPDYQFGFNNTFGYKNFELNVFIRGVLGHDLLNVNNAKFGVPASIAIQNGTTQALDYLEATNGPVFSDVHVEDASFVRLDNATLAYTFDMPKNHSLKRLRLYVSGQNLFTITDYTGVSPEVHFQDGDNPLAPGIDRERTYLDTRSFTFGANVTF